MNIKRILFPTDFSPDNDAALEYASALAAESGAMLYIVHVDDSTNVSAALGEPGYMYPSAWGPNGRREVRERLTMVIPSVASARYEHRYLTGSPVRELLKFARREHVDLIVMASHGRTGLARLLMESIAEGVMRGAQCPVVVVKQPASHREPAKQNETQAAYA
jgi:universal stress protein A